MTSNGKSSGNERGTRYGNGAYIGLFVQVFWQPLATTWKQAD